MSSNNPNGGLSSEQGRLLLDLSRQSIRHGLAHRHPLPVDLDGYAPELRIERATFVTLNLHGQLRGCIGSLQAHRPLVVDVSHNAYAAAFQDPRFPPVSDGECDRLELHISLLTSPEPFPVASEADLLAQMVQFEDGLILADGHRRGTFLPAVWESLPDPAQFLAHLKMKAGLPANHWSDTVRVWRYRAEVIGEDGETHHGGRPS
ncbi:AmmeMemoRadiSam system protein A [Methylomagnum sp.]